MIMRNYASKRDWNKAGRISASKTSYKETSNVLGQHHTHNPPKGIKKKGAKEEDDWEKIAAHQAVTLTKPYVRTDDDNDEIRRHIFCYYKCTKVALWHKNCWFWILVRRNESPSLSDSRQEQLERNKMKNEATDAYNNCVVEETQRKKRFQQYKKLLVRKSQKKKNVTCQKRDRSEKRSRYIFFSSLHFGLLESNLERNQKKWQKKSFAETLQQYFLLLYNMVANLAPDTCF